MHSRRTNRLTFSAGAILALLSCSASAQNLTINGDFTQGNTGFTSGYTSTTNLAPPQTYTVGTNPQLYNGSFSSFGDHTTGTGNMMIVNGAIVAGIPVWSQTVAIVPNQTYTFSAWVASNYFTNPATVQLAVNGMTVGPAFTASSTPAVFQQFSGTYLSGMNASAVLTITDSTTAFDGNDFALDDIRFIGPAPTAVPEPGSVALLVGLATTGAGFLSRRRRQQARNAV